MKVSGRRGDLKCWAAGSLAKVRTENIRIGSDMGKDEVIGR